MADRKKFAAGDDASLEVRRSIAVREKRIRDLESRVDGETLLAQRALEETLQARQERDEYRRVLAASLAQEKRATEDVQEHIQKAEALRARLDLVLEERGSTGAQIEALEVRLEQLASEGQAALRRAEEKTWGLSEEHGRAMRRVVQERGEAIGQLAEIQRSMPAPVPESLKATRVRAWVNMGIATFFVVLALLVLPGALLAVFTDDGALHMGVLVGLDSGQLVLLELALVACALVLGSWGIHELRGVEQRAEEQARVSSGVLKPNVGMESPSSGL